MGIVAERTSRRRLPGGLEIAIALAIYVVGISLLSVWISLVPDSRAAFRINIGGAANGVIGLVALLVAYRVRVRDWRAFGFRPSAPRWLLISTGLGVLAFGLSFIVEGIYFQFITEPNTQADFQTAAKGGLVPIALLLFTVAVLGPIGEELVFRGVIASALNRYGPWAGVVGSAALFAVIHGPSVILFDAFMVGILIGVVYRLAGSIWPAILLHVVYNGLHLVYYSTL